ncbi:MAG: hypothetical protein HS099_00580 [Ardenticatenaceae bacterium]|nr:hypothetical protein [Ardenticatenaceae bacterium]
MEAVPLLAADGRFAQVFVNDGDAFCGPAPGLGAGDELVLQVLGFEVFGHLAQGGLADVDGGQALAVVVMDFGVFVHVLFPPVVVGWWPGVCAPLCAPSDIGSAGRPAGG